MKKLRTTEKLFKGALLLAIFATIFYACKKNNSADETRSNVQDMTKNLGKMHNTGLDLISSKLRAANGTLASTNKGAKSDLPVEGEDPTPPPTVDISQVISDATSSVTSSVEYSNVTLTEPVALSSYLSTSFANINETYVEAQWDASFADTRLSTTLTTREASLVNQIYTIFNNASYGSTSPYTIKAQLEYLRSQNLNVNWEENEGEVFNGLLEIAISSAEYWSNAGNAPTLLTQQVYGSNGSKLATAPIKNKLLNGKLMDGPIVEGPSNEVPVSAIVIIQLDALGFLSGWASQAWADYNSPGGLKVSGQKQRIGQGLIWAVSASVGGFLTRVVTIPEPIDTPEVPVDTIP